MTRSKDNTIDQYNKACDEVSDGLDLPPWKAPELLPKQNGLARAIAALECDIEWYDVIATSKQERDRAHYAILADARNIIEEFKKK
jgi:hypothetical protein